MNPTPSLVVSARSKKENQGVDEVLAAVPVDSGEIYVKTTGTHVGLYATGNNSVRTAEFGSI